MSAEGTHTELKFTGDARFVSGIRAAVEFIAARDGLSDRERKDIGEAWEALARNCMANLSANQPLCKVLINDFEDRLEVRLEHPSCSQSVSSAKPSAPGESEAQRGQDALRRVDRILYDSRNGTSSVTLVKFFSKKLATPKPLAK